MTDPNSFFPDWNDAGSLILRQQESDTGDVRDLSYFRLGSYNADDRAEQSEASLITLLSTTSSQTHSNDGILLYTNHDLQENVITAAQARYGQGHAVEISTANASCRVSTGSYELSAKKGILISTGSEVSYGVTEQIADEVLRSAPIQITATGHINQNSGGDLKRTAMGLTVDSAYGSSTKLFYKSKTAIHLGMHNEMTVGNFANVVSGAELRILAGLMLDVSCLGSLRINLGVGVTIHDGDHTIAYHGGKTDSIVGCMIDTADLDIHDVVGGYAKIDVDGTLKFHSDGPITEDSKLSINYSAKFFSLSGNVHNNRVTDTFYLTAAVEYETANLKSESFDTFKRRSQTCTDTHKLHTQSVQHVLLAMKNRMVLN